MPPETTDQLAVVDVQLQSPRLASRDGIPLGEEHPTVLARAKLLPGGLPVQQMQACMHVGVDPSVAGQLADGELVALPDRYGKPVEVLKIVERMPWTRDAGSPRSHLVRLVVKTAQDPLTVAEELFAARERREKFVEAMEDIGVEAAVELLADEQRASLLVELRKRDAAAGDQPDAA